MDNFSPLISKFHMNANVKIGFANADGRLDLQ